MRRQSKIKSVLNVIVIMVLIAQNISWANPTIFQPKISTNIPLKFLSLFSGEICNIQYNSFNQKTSYDEKTIDKHGRMYHSQKSDIGYNGAGQISHYTKKDYEDSFQANTNPVTTTHIEYNALGQKTGYVNHGKDRTGASFSEVRSDIVYNIHGQVTSFESTGHNNGNSYGYARQNIKYESDDSSAKMVGYKEVGMTNDGVSYNETHRDIKYDKFDRIESEKVKGTSGDNSFDELRETSYYDSGEFEGRVRASKTTSLTNSDVSETNQITYDANGHRKSFYTTSTKDGKNYRAVITQRMEEISDGMFRVTWKNEKGHREDKAFNETTSGYRYDGNGRATGYTIKGDGFTKSVSSISYDSLGRKTKMVYTDSRNSDFKVGGDTLIETYDYKSNGALSSSTLTTPDYVVRFDGKGNKIGEVEETSAFKEWKEAEIAKMRAEAEAKAKAEAEKQAKAARRRAEEKYRRGQANTMMAVDRNGNQMVIPFGGGMGILQMLQGNVAVAGARGFGGFAGIGGMRGFGRGSPQGTLGFVNRMFTPQQIQTKLALNQKAEQLAVKIASGEYKKTLQTEIRRQMARIQITNPKLDAAAIQKAVEKAVKVAIPDFKESKRVLGKFNKGLQLLQSNIFKEIQAKLQGKLGKIKHEIKIEAKNPDGSVDKIEQEFLDVLMAIESGQSIDLGMEQQGPVDMASFMQAVQGMEEPIEFYQYDENGNLKSKQKMTQDFNAADGMTHTKLETVNYDKDGYEIGTDIHETFASVNENYTVDTHINPDGTSTSHIKGKIKSEANGRIEDIDETREMTMVATKNGFKVITDVTDNLTGLKSKTTDTYSNCKYHDGKLIEYNLHSVTEGERYQNVTTREDVEVPIYETFTESRHGLNTTGETETVNMDVTRWEKVKIRTESRTKQYGAKIDEQGRLYEYKQDKWDNSAPNKNTTVQINITEFDAKDRALSQTTQTWEKGHSVNGMGDPIELDSYSVAIKTNMQYNSSDQLTSYDEVTYTQELYTAPKFGEYAEENGFNYGSGYLNNYEETEAVHQNVQGGIGDARKVGKVVTHNGNAYMAQEGYVWAAENTSKCGISYDYAGRMSFWKDGKGKANRTVYDHVGLVKSSYNGISGERQYDISYDSVGRKTEWRTKGRDSVYGRHKAQYNDLGQMVYKYTEQKANTKKYRMHKIYHTQYSYDKMGEQQKINEWYEKDVFKKKTTLGQIITIIVAIIVIIYTWGAASTAASGMISASQAATAASIAAAGAAAATAVDGGSLGDCFKAAAIAFVTTYFGAQISSGAGASFSKEAANIGTAAFDVGKFAATGATYCAQQTALNTVVNLLQGQKFGEALRGGFYSALASTIAAGISGSFKAGDIKKDGQFNWANFGKQFGKEFLANAAEAALNAAANGADFEEAMEVGAISGLASALVSSVGVAFRETDSSVLKGFGEGTINTGPNVMESSVDNKFASLPSMVRGQLVSKVQEVLLTELSNQMGEREAAFLTSVLGGMLSASLDNAEKKYKEKKIEDAFEKATPTFEDGKEYKSATVGGEEYRMVDGKISVKGENNQFTALYGDKDPKSNLYVSSMKESFIKESIKHGFIALARELGGNEEMTLFVEAFGEALSDNFNLQNMKNAIKAYDLTNKEEEIIWDGGRVVGAKVDVTEESIKENETLTDSEKEEREKLAARVDVIENSLGGTDGDGPKGGKIYKNFMFDSNGNLNFTNFEIQNSLGETIGKSFIKTVEGKDFQSVVQYALDKDGNVMFEKIDGKEVPKVATSYNYYEGKLNYTDEYKEDKGFTRKYADRPNYMENRDKDGKLLGSVEVTSKGMLNLMYGSNGEVLNALLLDLDKGMMIPRGLDLKGGVKDVRLSQSGFIQVYGDKGSLMESYHKDALLVRDGDGNLIKSKLYKGSTNYEYNNQGRITYSNNRYTNEERNYDPKTGRTIKLSINGDEIKGYDLDEVRMVPSIDNKTKEVKGYLLVGLDANGEVNINDIREVWHKGAERILKEDGTLDHSLKTLENGDIEKYNNTGQFEHVKKSGAEYNFSEDGKLLSQTQYKDGEVKAWLGNGQEVSINNISNQEMTKEGYESLKSSLINLGTFSLGAKEILIKNGDYAGTILKGETSNTDILITNKNTVIPILKNADIKNLKYVNNSKGFEGVIYSVPTEEGSSEVKQIYYNGEEGISIDVSDKEAFYDDLGNIRGFKNSTWAINPKKSNQMYKIDTYYNELGMIMFSRDDVKGVGIDYRDTNAGPVVYQYEGKYGESAFTKTYTKQGIIENYNEFKDLTQKVVLGKNLDGKSVIKEKYSYDNYGRIEQKQIYGEYEKTGKDGKKEQVYGVKEAYHFVYKNDQVVEMNIDTDYVKQFGTKEQLEGLTSIIKEGVNIGGVTGHIKYLDENGNRININSKAFEEQKEAMEYTATKALAKVELWEEHIDSQKERLERFQNMSFDEKAALYMTGYDLQADIVNEYVMDSTWDLVKQEISNNKLGFAKDIVVGAIGGNMVEEKRIGHIIGQTGLTLGAAIVALGGTALITKGATAPLLISTVATAGTLLKATAIRDALGSTTLFVAHTAGSSVGSGEFTYDSEEAKGMFIDLVDVALSTKVIGAMIDSARYSKQGGKIISTVSDLKHAKQLGNFTKNIDETNKITKFVTTYIPEFKTTQFASAIENGFNLFNDGGKLIMATDKFVESEGMEKGIAGTALVLGSLAFVVGGTKNVLEIKDAVKAGAFKNVKLPDSNITQSIDINTKNVTQVDFNQKGIDADVNIQKNMIDLDQKLPKAVGDDVGLDVQLGASRKVSEVDIDQTIKFENDVKIQPKVKTNTTPKSKPYLSSDTLKTQRVKSVQDILDNNGVNATAYETKNGVFRIRSNEPDVKYQFKNGQVVNTTKNKLVDNVDLTNPAFSQRQQRVSMVQDVLNKKGINATAYETKNGVFKIRSNDGVNKFQLQGGEIKNTTTGAKVGEVDINHQVFKNKNIEANLPENVFHATKTKLENNSNDVQNILKGIDPQYLGNKTRFGKAFYVAENPKTSLAEMNYHNTEVSHGIRYDFDKTNANILDLTNPDMAKKWNYDGGDSYVNSQKIAEIAKQKGYNVIKFTSERGLGNNYAILDDFNDLLKPQMITKAELE